MPKHVKRYATLDWSSTFRAGVSKLRPAGQIRPAKLFHPAREGISSGRTATDILSIMKIQYIYETFVDLVERNLFRKNHIAQDVRPSNCCAAACVTLWQKSLETSALEQYVLLLSVSVKKYMWGIIRCRNAGIRSLRRAQQVKICPHRARSKPWECRRATASENLVPTTRSSQITLRNPPWMTLKSRHYSDTHNCSERFFH